MTRNKTADFREVGENPPDIVWSFVTSGFSSMEKESNTEAGKNLIVDRDYHFWQVRKNWAGVSAVFRSVKSGG